MSTNIWLCLISLFLALFTVIISKSTKNKYTEVLAIPVIVICSFIFGNSDTHDTRVKTTAILIISYVIFYGIISLSYWGIIKLISRTSKTAEEQKTLAVTLPLDYNYPIDDRFIEDFPANVDSLVHVSEEIRLLTENFVKSFSLKTIDEDRETEIKSYFLGICYHIASLFDNSTRVHVRMLKDRVYQKYVATCDGAHGREYNDSMKVMSYENKMINESFNHKCSLIKTANPTLHEDGNNRKWKNYLMFSLPQIVHDDKPVFSVGISITKKRNDLFYFLNYCEIETIIGRHIKCIASVPEIKSFIENFYFSST